MAILSYIRILKTLNALIVRVCSIMASTLEDHPILIGGWIMVTPVLARNATRCHFLDGWQRPLYRHQHRHQCCCLAAAALRFHLQDIIQRPDMCLRCTSAAASHTGVNATFERVASMTKYLNQLATYLK